MHLHWSVYWLPVPEYGAELDVSRNCLLDGAEEFDFMNKLGQCFIGFMLYEWRTVLSGIFFSALGLEPLVRHRSCNLEIQRKEKNYNVLSKHEIELSTLTTLIL